MRTPSLNFNTADNPRIEPGLISVFILFTAVYLILELISFAARWIAGEMGLMASTVFSTVWLALLLAYLIWPELQARMGRAYLPVALGFASLMPVVDRSFLLWLLRSMPSLETLPLVIGSSWRLLLALFLPLILIAWQYRFVHVIAFIAGTTLLDILLVYLAWGDFLSYEMGIVVLGSVRAIVYLAVGYLVVRMMSAQRAQRAELAEANRRLAHYAATIDQLATSRERNRLARELHDTLAHTLSGLAVQLEAIDAAWQENADQAHMLLTKALAGTRSGLTETRRALQALRASPLDDLGVALAIRTMAQTTAARSGAALSLDLPERVDSLSPQQEQALYRIAQEAMDNAVRHSGASAISISLHETDGRLRLRVTDNGSGFDAGELDRAGYGLRGMQERAALAGGSLSVSSEPGEGTSVTLSLPSDRASAGETST